MIRKFTLQDQTILQEQYSFHALVLQYHGDIIKVEEEPVVFTCVDEQDVVRGFLYFQYHYSWNTAITDKTPDAYNKILPVICCQEKDRDTWLELMRYAIQWFEEQQFLFTGKKAVLALWEESTDLETIRQELKLGFIEDGVCPCLRYDLRQDIPEYPIPEELQIGALSYEPTAVDRYIAATGQANEGEMDSVSELWFMTGDDSFRVYVIVDGDTIVSAASIWHIEEDRAAIENIFCIPEYRHRGLAKAVITHGLKELQKQGYHYATLSMKGQNKKASKLYHSLGFELFFNQIELIYLK